MTLGGNTYRRFRKRIADIEEPENFTLLAVSLWRMLLGLLVLVGVLSVMYGFSLMQDVLALLAPADTAAQNSLPSDSNRKDLDAIAAGFSARKGRSDQLKAQPTSVADPSK